MGLKFLKPVTPGMRGTALIDRSELYSGRPEKSLVRGHAASGGRNNLGRVTVRGRGGGVKRKLRMVDFSCVSIVGDVIVQRIEYDPNRSAHIALVKQQCGKLTYVLAGGGMKIGDVLSLSGSGPVKNGNRLKMEDIPVGIPIHNVEVKPGRGGQLARAAGSSISIVGKGAGQVLLRLRSGKNIAVPANCMASLGAVSNPDNKNVVIGCAGRNRRRGIRPITRGVAKNPIDHPHGGGEGRTSSGRHPVTPWGKKTKGMKTRHRKKVGSMSRRSIV